ncbi:hypothetical protein L3Q82_008395 [Scortum barcoo]|uniref:Uncharacterized protein n=1 Tax=Scortum barcoo TaxID=214431 RepID=A0ACB8XB33_9TELE|nr:hypothetical protein L3Q82_008395 [Scortum barcoo]
MLLPGNASSCWAELLDSNRSGAAPGGGSRPEAVIVPVVFGLIFVVGVVGNSLVMVVIGKVRFGGDGGVSSSVRARGRRRTGSPTNIFILNLSVADLSFLLFCVPFHATIYSLPEWVFGAFLCRFGHYFSTVSMLVSIFTLVAMSVDRYVAVVLSGKAPCVRSRRTALAGVAVIWTLSLVCSVPVAQHQVLTNHPSAPNSTFCWEQWSGASKQTYKVSVLLVGYLLPLLLISCCYTKDQFHIVSVFHPSADTESQFLISPHYAYAYAWLRTAGPPTGPPLGPLLGPCSLSSYRFQIHTLPGPEESNMDSKKKKKKKAQQRMNFLIQLRKFNLPQELLIQFDFLMIRSIQTLLSVLLQTAQTVLLVVTSFTICWMPHHIIAMWVEFGTFPLNDASFAFRIISHCLSYGNSCVNPVLYAFLSENFRKACRQVFTCSFLYPPPPSSKTVRFRMENFSTTHSTTNI